MPFIVDFWALSAAYTTYYISVSQFSTVFCNYVIYMEKKAWQREKKREILFCHRRYIGKGWKMGNFLTVTKSNTVIVLSVQVRAITYFGRRKYMVIMFTFWDSVAKFLIPTLPWSLMYWNRNLFYAVSRPIMPMYYIPNKYIP